MSRCSPGIYSQRKQVSSRAFLQGFADTTFKVQTGLALRFGQAEQLDRVFLENQGADFIADRNLFEIG